MLVIYSGVYIEKELNKTQFCVRIPVQKNFIIMVGGSSTVWLLCDIKMDSQDDTLLMIGLVKEKRVSNAWHRLLS